MIEPKTWENVGEHRTSNGVVITPGLYVLDYNYRRTYVSHPCATRHRDEPQWFIMENGGMFDGSRLRAI